MRDVVRNERQLSSGPAPQNLVCRVPDLLEMLQEDRLPAGIEPPFGAERLAAKLRIERIRHAVDVTGEESGVLQAERDRLLGQDLRVVYARFFAMLDAGEPLLLAGGHHLAIDNQCGRGFMKDRIESKNVHAVHST